MPKIIDHNLQRKVLLEKALVFFVKRGYRATEMRGLLKELKVSAGAFYHYFPDKDAFVGELISFISDRVSNSVASYLKNSNVRGIDQLFQWLQENETNLLAELLLLIDLYRDQYSKRGKLDSTGPIDGFLFHVQSLLKSSVQLSGKVSIEPETRFFTTYLVGILIVRMWAPKEFDVMEFKNIMQNSTRAIQGRMQ